MKIKIISLFLFIVIIFGIYNVVSNKTSYAPLNISDSGLIKEDGNVISTLPELLKCLEEKNIEVLEIRCSNNARINDAGNVDFEGTNWNLIFYLNTNKLDKNNTLNDFINDNSVNALYIKTRYEFITFILYEGIVEKEISERFFSNIIITTHPYFETKRGLKIGDKIEDAIKKYNFDASNIINHSDSKWEVWISDSNIILSGTDNKITSFKLGYKSMCNS